MPRSHRPSVLVVAVATVLVSACSGSSAHAAPATTTSVGTAGHGASASPARAPRHGRLPSEATWKADVAKAMHGSGAYLEQRVQQGGGRLAINLDIDNTMIATQYDPGHAVVPVRRFVRKARSLGVAVLVNTARVPANRAETRHELRAAGYRIDELCLHAPGTTIPGGKQACRRHFAAEGYTLIANVGNRSTDFVGGGYERAFKLPSYHRALG